MKFSEKQKNIMDQIVSVFENSTTEQQFDSIVELGDGRGFTAGIAGWTTSDGDMLNLFRNYNKPPMNAFIPQLERLEEEDSDNTIVLKSMGLVKAWADACEDPDFISCQTLVRDETYFNPALKLADQYDLTSDLALLCLYDSSIQHGCDDDPDSLPAMLARTDTTTLDPDAIEYDFIKSFLIVRRKTLMNPSNHDSRDEWRDSVGRVDTLEDMLKKGLWDLDTPFTINPFGDEFEIK